MQSSFHLVRCVLLAVVLCLLTSCSIDSAPFVLPPLPWQQPDKSLSVNLILAAPNLSEIETDYIRQLSRSLSALDPEIQLAVETSSKLLQALDPEPGASEPADLVLINGNQLPALIASGYLAPIPVEINRSEDTYPNLRTGYVSDGVTYCQPRGVNTLALVFNKDLFDRAGLPYPQSQWTWSDLRGAAQSLTNANFGRFGLVLMADYSRWLPFYYQAGGEPVGTETMHHQFDSPAAALALAYFLDLFLKGYAVEPDYLNSTWGGEALAKGRAAMTIEGSWLVPYLRNEFPDLDFGVVQLPIGPSARATVAFTSCLGVTTHSRNVGIAQQVAAFLTSLLYLPAWNEHTGEMSPYPSLADKALERSPDYAPFISAIESAHVWQLPPGSEDLVDAFNDALREVIYEEAAIEAPEGSPDDSAQAPTSRQAAEEILRNMYDAAETLYGDDVSTISK